MSNVWSSAKTACKNPLLFLALAFPPAAFAAIAVLFTALAAFFLKGKWISWGNSLLVAKSEFDLSILAALTHGNASLVHSAGVFQWKLPYLIVSASALAVLPLASYAVAGYAGAAKTAADEKKASFKDFVFFGKAFWKRSAILSLLLFAIGTLGECASVFAEWARFPFWLLFAALTGASHFTLVKNDCSPLGALAQSASLPWRLLSLGKVAAAEFLAILVLLFFSYALFSQWAVLIHPLCAVWLFKTLQTEKKE